MWLQPYESGNDYNTTDFKNDVDALWEEMSDLYYKLHAYVRYKLRNSGPYEAEFGEESPIPAHILGKFFFFFRGTLFLRKLYLKNFNI